MRARQKPISGVSRRVVRFLRFPGGGAPPEPLSTSKFLIPVSLTDGTPLTVHATLELFQSRPATLS